jgi:DNA-binding response OmpR family regulator
MPERPCQVLIVDLDQDALLTLQHVLEDAGFDTTISWDEAEARHLLKQKVFDLILLGDHPPELDAEAFLRDCRMSGRAFFILRWIVSESDVARFQEFGVIGVAAKWDSLGVLEQVRKHWLSRGRKAATEAAA